MVFVDFFVTLSIFDLNYLANITVSQIEKIDINKIDNTIINKIKEMLDYYFD
jgi:hypothetical protein